MSAGFGTTDAALLLHPVKVPLDDPSVDALSDVTRQAIARRWMERIRSELEVGLAFGDLAERLTNVGAEPSVVQLAAESALQEREHAELCHQLAERYGGETVSMPSMASWKPVDFGCTDERLEVLFQVAGMCCINETIAGVWLRHCVGLSESPIALAAHRMHLREEILHARVGWAHLASDAVTPAMRQALSRRLSELMRVNTEQWLQPGKYVEGGVPGHGQPSLEESRAVVRQAVEQVVVPGFAHLGVWPER